MASSMSTHHVEYWIYLFIVLVVLLQVVASLVPSLQQALSSLGNITGLPLGSLFSANGVVMTIIIAALLIFIVRMAFGSFKKGEGKKY